MSFSNEEQAQMQDTAGGLGNSQSLAEGLQEQLSRAKGQQQKFDEYQPTAQANAEAIGSFDSRAAGESPTAIRAEGMTTADAISKRASTVDADVMSVLSEMMGLRKQQEAEKQSAFDREMAIQERSDKLAADGLIIDESTGKVRGMTDKEREENVISKIKEAEEDADPVVWLKKQPGGLKIAQSETSVAGLESTAQAIKEAGSIEAYLNSNPNAIWNKDELKAKDAARNTLTEVEAALAYFRDDEGNIVDVRGVGQLGGNVPSIFAGKEGRQIRKNISQITNEKIKEMSGAAVSDQEAARLATQLPNANDNEETLRFKLENIQASIRIGEEMKKKSILEGISLDDAYLKYGEQEYLGLNQEVPKWLDQKLESGEQPKSGADSIDSEDEDLIKKYGSK